MMKPDWEDAPEWAKHLAMDSDGRWAWHEREPQMYAGGWVSHGRVRHAVYQELPEWDDSLESRP